MQPSRSARHFYYSYDANDELIAKGPNSDGSGASAFTYDSLGNLLASQPAGPDHSTLLPTSYTYDPPGTCSRSTISHPPRRWSS